MKLAAAFAIALVLPAVASAGWVLENRIENPGLTINATVRSTGDKFRIDTAGGPRGATSTILDLSADYLLLLVHEKKTAQKVARAGFRQQLDKLQKGAQAASEFPPPKATGEKEKVGDWECEIYTWKNGGSSIRLWVASNVPKGAEVKAVLDKLYAQGVGAVDTAPDYTGLPGVVVKTETTTTGTGRKSTQTIRSLKEENIDPAVFNVPADYAVKEVPVDLRAVPPKSSGAAGAEKKAK